MNARRGLRAILVVLACVLVGSTAQPAVAADLTQFDPGLIISDSIFYNTTTMSAADVQAFLESKGSACKPASDGTACLKDYRQTTWSRATDGRCATDYAGATNETAAQIITKVARACGINPQVLLVTLQKEQGLVTRSTAGTAATYQKAMGYDCPDTAPCAAQYFGFFNQVYSAAAQFQRYKQHPTSYNYVAGRLNTILYYPSAACGSSQVLIQDQATAGLYNYTPYQPNAAALAAGYGKAPPCGSYGNRNFWNFFTDWFGSTTQRPPFGSVDTMTTGPDFVTVRGWALDPDTTDPISVRIDVDSHGTTVVAGAGRTDVGRIFGKGDLHGYNASVPTTAGTHTVCVTALDSVGGPGTTLGCRTLTVVNLTPIGHVDAVRPVTGGGLYVGGWALDPDTANPIGVHVYVDGTGTAWTANGSRPDIGTKYGLGDLHGFGGTIAPVAAGPHRVCVYAINTPVGPNPTLSCATVTVPVTPNDPPFGSVDAMTTGLNTVTVRGWALDPDTTKPITVRIDVDSTGTTVTANAGRTDVGRTYGKGDLHGYTTTVPATTGTHRVCVTAIDSTTGPSTSLGCRTLTVVNASPIGYVDAIRPVTGGGIYVAGWALDPDTTNPIGVHVYVDGTGIAWTANGSRPDVGRAYGLGDLHGFSGTTPAAAPGPHQVCVYAINTPAGPNPTLACTTVTVPS